MQCGPPHPGSDTTVIQHIILPNCSLEGALPAALKHLRGVTILFLDQNQLTGPLPTEWSAMAGMQELVSHKSADRDSPEWSAMAGLHELGLYTNQLTGTLPTEWSAMAGMQGCISTQIT